MRFILLFTPILFTGCLAAAVGAAGSNAEKDEDVDYYLKTHDVEPPVRRAMKERKLTESMTPPQVRLTMGAKTDYGASPDQVEQTDGGEVWVYENTDPMTPATYKITFEAGKVTRHVEQ